MLKRILIITIFFVLGGLGISLYFQSHKDNTLYRVFSNNTSLNKISTISINSADIIEATNKERVAIGLAPLSVSAKLNSSAEIKVDDMIKNQYFEHQSPDGKGVADLGREVGYEYVIMGENLAMGTFMSSDEIVQAWMNSPGHRANMLNKKYQNIGVSVKQGMYQGKKVWFAVQHFGTGRSVCPIIDTTLKTEIDAMNSQLKEEEGIINVLKKSLEAPGASTGPSYQTDVEAFNKSVDDYNSRLQTSRQEIDKYNLEVKNFNNCIATFQ